MKSYQLTSSKNSKGIEQSHPTHISKRISPSKRVRPCLNCERCRDLQRRIQAIDNAYVRVFYLLITILRDNNASMNNHYRSLPAITLNVPRHFGKYKQEC